MSRERELLRECLPLIIDHYYLRIVGFKDEWMALIINIEAILAQPEAEPDRGPDACQKPLEYFQRDADGKLVFVTPLAPPAQGATPETDAIRFNPYGPSLRELLQKFEKIERQRDALRAENERLRKQYELTEKSMLHWNSEYERIYKDNERLRELVKSYQAWRAAVGR